MKTERTTILPLVGKQSPFNIARIWYAQYSDLSFGNDLVDHLENGFVYSGSDCFAMAKIIDLNDSNTPPHDPGWFIRIAVGPIDVLLKKLPVKLPTISFCRRNDHVVRFYNWERFERLAKRMIRRNT